MIKIPESIQKNGYLTAIDYSYQKFCVDDLFYVEIIPILTFGIGGPRLEINMKLTDDALRKNEGHLGPTYWSTKAFLPIPNAPFHAKGVIGGIIIEYILRNNGGKTTLEFLLRNVTADQEQEMHNSALARNHVLDE